MKCKRRTELLNQILPEEVIDQNHKKVGKQIKSDQKDCSLGIRTLWETKVIKHPPFDLGINFVAVGAGKDQGIRIGSGVEVASLADFTTVMMTAKDDILEQLGGGETTAVILK